MGNEKKPFYAVLHGAKKNVGDFLIRDRSEKLIRHVRPDRELKAFPSWKPLDEHLETINEAEAIIVMGGPGVSQSSYPEVYPFVDNLDRIKPPIYLMGVGSYMYPFTSKAIRTFKFSSRTRLFLEKCKGISVRDVFTKNLITSKGIHNVVMTGCPVWHNLEFTEKGVQKPEEIKSILFSFPQKHYFHEQAFKLASSLKAEFPHARLIAGFNRGLKADKYTSSKDAARFSKAAKKLEGIGYEVVNHAYDLQSLEDQKICDLHVGYRLHSHIYFASMRKPSFVIAEDSRSYGHYTTLGLPGQMAYNHSLFAEWLPYLENGMIRGGIFKFLPVVDVPKSISDLVIEQIDRELSNDYPSFEGIDKKLDSYLGEMKSFLKNLP
ncbi:polysaccharide pyruvyl transferase family protein [Halocola ammonii]